jgi:hypothetical protein
MPFAIAGVSIDTEDDVPSHGNQFYDFQFEVNPRTQLR